MRTQIVDQWQRAMTAVEVLVVVVCVVMFVALLLPALAPARRHSGPNCVSNLGQINLAFRIWAEDNNNQYPMSVSVTNGGAMEQMEIGNIAACFQVASNELSTTKILVCPADPGRTFATNWNELDSSHVSYFLSADASYGAGRSFILAGDDNLEINRTPVKSGLVDVSSDALIGWAPGRHGSVYRPYFWSSPKTNGFGNYVFADGGFRQASSMNLQQAFQGTGLATNRILIP